MSDKKIIFINISFPVSKSQIKEIQKNYDTRKNIIILVNENPKNSDIEYYSNKEPGIYILQT